MATLALTSKELRDRRHKRVRARVSATALRPRLAVYKSNRFISVQLIDDEAGTTLASATGRTQGGTLLGAVACCGARLSRLAAKKAGIDTVVFDRGGYEYGGQVKALADAARAGGLTF